MNAIHTLAWYFPESTGGTEVYVAGLVKELSALGIGGRVAAAHTGTGSSDGEHEGVAVHRYPFPETVDTATTRGTKPPPDFESFVAWLERQPRGIYHQHSWTTSCGAHHLRAAKSLGFRTVLTVHLPSNFCLRGTMMEFGDAPCDGRVTATRCAACWSQGRGLPRPAARALSRLPAAVSRAAYRSGAKSRLATALSARELAATCRREIAAMAGTADRIVAVCGWLKEALRCNGIAEEKLTLSRQGVDSGLAAVAGCRRQGTGRFRLGFLGRCDPIKGLPVLLDALDLLPRDLSLELVIHTVANLEADRRLRDSLKARMAGDPRVTFLPPVDRAQLAGVLGAFDMLAVPSQCLETGPLVVLEAQACGVPVLGSDLGGIAELVSPGVDGHLVRHSDRKAWADAIRAAIGGALPCQQKPGAPQPVRSMADAAQDMAALYAELA